MMKYKCIKEHTGFRAHKGDTFNKKGEHIVNKDNSILCHVDSYYGKTLFEVFKQTPYEYLIEYYGLVEGKRYSSNGSTHTFILDVDGRSILDSDGDDVFYGDCIDVINGTATFTEVPQKKTSLVIGGEHYSVADEQLEQIKKIIE